MYRISLEKFEIVVLEIGGHIEMNDLTLQQHDIIIGSKFLLLNPGSEYIRLKGIVIQSNTSLSTKEFPLMLQKCCIGNRFSDVFASFDSDQSHSNIVNQINLILPQLISLLYKYVDSSIQNKTKEQSGGFIDQRLIFINRYIRKNYQNPLTLQLLAELIQCNPVYLSNTYSRIFQISPMKFLQKYRMEKAKELLLKSDLSVGELANQLGYISASQFTEIFKRHYLVTPRQYRYDHKLSLLKYESNDHNKL